jgi:outer membrane protein
MKLFIGLNIIIALILISCKGEEIHSKVVYMDTLKVFEKFEMKKDYDSKLEKDLESESNLLNSISSKLEDAKKRNSNKEIEILERDLNGAQQLFNEKFQALSNQYTAEVYKRLNGYLKEFGDKHGFDLVLGTSGQGNIMYVADKCDLTSEIITFINGKYSE